MHGLLLKLRAHNWVILALCAGMALAEETTMKLNADWSYVADTVMGGVSKGQLTEELVERQMAHRLTGEVSTDNNGGFIQMASDLADGDAFDASGWTGVEIDVIGNGEVYDLRLRTDQLTQPWQSFRTEFTATADWSTQRFPFTAFEPHRTEATFDPARLRRIGILAIGREFRADVAVAGLRLYR